MNKTEEQLRKKSPIQIRNKKASFEYFFVETYTAGIVLTGTEIKSILIDVESINNGDRMKEREILSSFASTWD